MQEARYGRPVDANDALSLGGGDGRGNGNLDGSIPSTTIPGFGEYRYSPQTLRPFTTVIPEMFKIRDGRIVQIEATMASIPYGSKSRWE